jgi:hypothetical protein
MNEICKAHATLLRHTPGPRRAPSRARVRAPVALPSDTSLRCAVKLQSSCVFCALVAESARGSDAGSLTARVRGLFICIPRAPLHRYRNTAERSSTDLSRGPKKHRTPRNIAAFSAPEIYQTAPLCQAERSGSSACKPRNPRRSRLRARARARAAVRTVGAHAQRARARNARRFAATRPRLHIPCHRVMRCCVGVAAILTVASAIHRPGLRIPAPRRTLRHPPGRGIERPVLGNLDAASTRGF